MASTLDLLKRLVEKGVEFVVVGGMASVAHGSTVVTQDVDVCAPFTVENMTRVLLALHDVRPRYRMRPEHPALPDDPAVLATWKNLYVMTDMGQLDILGEIAGVGGYSEVSRQAVTMQLAGQPLRVLDLDALIQSKRALGRPKDQRVANELEAIRARIKGK